MRDTYIEGPYTVSSSDIGFPVTRDSIIDAVELLIGRRVNCPTAAHTITDRDGYIVPESYYSGFLTTIRQRAIDTLVAVEIEVNRQKAQARAEAIVASRRAL